MSNGFDVGSVITHFKADLTGLQSGIKTAKSEVNGLKTNVGDFGKLLTSTAGMFGVALGGAAVIGFLKASVDAFNESQKVMAQTQAVLKSTAGVAGVTADEVTKLAKTFQSQTTYSDEAVQSAENLLLTFTNIKDRIFPQATQTVLDMSTALGQDLSSSSIQLGKALQDPILGVTALRRVGVNFSTAQQDVIKKLVETGHAAEAQDMILKELATEFGGSATAAASTFGGQILQAKNALDDLMELIGGALVPVLQDLATDFGGVAQVLGGVLLGAIRLVATALEGLISLCHQIGIVLSGIFAAAGFAIQGDWESAGQAFKVTMTDMGNEADRSATQISKIWGQETTKQVNTSKAGYRDIQTESSKNAKKLAKHAEEETRKYNEEVKKRTASYEQSMADLVHAHLQKKKDLEKEMSDENASFADDLSTRKSDFEETMADLKDSHQTKVDDITSQIDEETAKGVNADQKVLESLQARLLKENVEYEKQKAKDEARYNEEIARLTKQHQDKLTALAEELKVETDILNAHQDEVNKYKDQAVEDDITRLKKSFESEMAELKTQHERKLQDFYEQGYAETEAYNKGKQQANSDDTVKAVNNAKTQAAKTASTIKSTVAIPNLITNVGVGSNAASTPAASNSKSFLQTAWDAISNFTSNLFHFADGGIVPGAPGEAQLIVAHGQEKIIPPGRKDYNSGSGGISVSVNMPGAIISDSVAARRLAEDMGDAIVRKLQMNVRI